MAIEHAVKKPPVIASSRWMPGGSWAYCDATATTRSAASSRLH